MHWLLYKFNIIKLYIEIFETQTCSVYSIDTTRDIITWFIEIIITDILFVFQIWGAYSIDASRERGYSIDALKNHDS